MRPAVLSRTIPLLIMASLVACGGPSAIPVTRLRFLVLQPQDVGPRLTQYEFRPQDAFDFRAGPLDRAGDAGWQGGWVARYRQPPASLGPGPLIVVSLADAFRTEQGAERGLDAYRNDFQTRVRSRNAQLVQAPKIGDEAAAISIVQRQGVMPSLYYRIAWRERNVVAFIDVSGFEGQFSFPDVVQLARRQQRHISAAGK